MKEGEWCDSWRIHAFLVSLLYMSSGPDCLKLTTSLVNVSLKFQI